MVGRVRSNNLVVLTAIKYLFILETYRSPKYYFAPSATTDWQKAAAKLKPFSAKASGTWFEIVWSALCADYEGHPEKDPKLRPLGLYRAKHSINRGGLTATGTRNANIRDGIKEKLKSACNRLALQKNPKK